MTQMQPPLVGTFQNSQLAVHAMDELRSSGFSKDEIHFAGHPAKGGFFDNLKNWFSGEDASPEGVARDLRGSGLSEDAVNYYTNQYEAGDSLVAVNSPEHEQDAFLILQNNGADMFNGVSGDSSNRGTYRQGENLTQQEMQTSGVTDEYATSKPPMDTTRRRGARVDEGESIHLRGERLQAEKRQVQTGEVWISKEIIAEEQSIEVPISHEEIVIEHHTNGERLADAPVGQEERIHVTLNEEQVDVTKVPVEMDEISVRKRNVEETKRFTDSVRHEEARVEKSGDVDIRGFQDDLKDQR